MTDDLREWVIQKVVEHLPEEDADKAVPLVENASDYFIERTRRGSIPLRARRLWVDIALAIYAKQDRGQSIGRVSSIKRGNTTIQYNGEEGAQIGLDAMEERIALFRAGRLL